MDLLYDIVKGRDYWYFERFNLGQIKMEKG